MHFLFFFAFPANLSSLTKWRVIAVQQKPKQHRAQARQHTDRPYLKRETKRDEEKRRDEGRWRDKETTRYDEVRTKTNKYTKGASSSSFSESSKCTRVH